ncbi:MAG: twin-arginine translocation signal domain-containing protein [Rhodospirillales bacterium]|nr:twin-arginine translocation signal domain-containing protein [Rhodospirillales bacterium]
MAHNQQSLEIDRRDFIKFVFGTASAVALSGASSTWPTEALTRPIAEPAKLALDDYNYLIDPYFDFNPQLPTYREFLSLEDLSNSELKDAVKDDMWRFEHHLKDPDNWSALEIQGWLEESIDFDDMSPWTAAKYTEYGNGMRLYDALHYEDARGLNLTLVEGDVPGSNFCGVRYDGDFEEDFDDLNRDLAGRGIYLIIQGGNG